MSPTCLQALSEEHGTLVGRQLHPISPAGRTCAKECPALWSHTKVGQRMENLEPQPLWLLCGESILGRRQGSGLQPCSYGSEKPGEDSRNVFWESKEQVFKSVIPGTERELRETETMDTRADGHSNAPQLLPDILLKLFMLMLRKAL